MTRCLSPMIFFYNIICTPVADKHTPLKIECMIVHSQSPWFSSKQKKAKQERRHAERRNRKTGLPIRKDMFIYKKKVLTLRSRRGGGYHHPPRGFFQFFFKNAKFLILVVPANLRKLYCSHFGIKIIFLTINVLCCGLAKIGKSTDFGQFWRVTIPFHQCFVNKL